MLSFLRCVVSNFHCQRLNVPALFERNSTATETNSTLPPCSSSSFFTLPKPKSKPKQSNRRDNHISPSWGKLTGTREAQYVSTHSWACAAAIFMQRPVPEVA